jgi:Cupin
MDALSETLRVVHLVGAIFINARFTAPWCYQSPSADSAAPLLEPGAERVVIFHLITEGECYVEIGDDAPRTSSSGRHGHFSQGSRASHDLSTWTCRRDR